MTIKIVPVPSYPGTATQLRCVSMSVNLGHGANVVWHLLDADDQQASQNVSSDLTAEQYAEWTGSDTFVAKCIAENNGLKPA